MKCNGYHLSAVIDGWHFRMWASLPALTLQKHNNSWQSQTQCLVRLCVVRHVHLAIDLIMLIRTRANVRNTCLNSGFTILLSFNCLNKPMTFDKHSKNRSWSWTREFQTRTFFFRYTIILTQQEQMYTRLAVLFLAMVCLLKTALAMSIDIQPHENECFYEELERGDKLSVTFQVNQWAWLLQSLILKRANPRLDKAETWTLISG